MVQMLKLLPKNFNISELPPSVIKAAMKGEVPDLSELPPSVLQHFKDNIDEIMKSLNMGSSVSVLHCFMCICSLFFSVFDIM